MSKFALAVGGGLLLFGSPSNQEKEKIDCLNKCEIEAKAICWKEPDFRNVERCTKDSLKNSDWCMCSAPIKKPYK